MGLVASQVMFSVEASGGMNHDVSDTVVFWGISWRPGIEACALLVVTTGCRPVSTGFIRKRIPTRIISTHTAIFNIDGRLFSIGTLSGKVLSRLTASWPL